MKTSAGLIIAVAVGTILGTYLPRPPRVWAQASGAKTEPWNLPWDKYHLKPRVGQIVHSTHGMLFFTDEPLKSTAKVPVHREVVGFACPSGSLPGVPQCFVLSR